MLSIQSKAIRKLMTQTEALQQLQQQHSQSDHEALGHNRYLNNKIKTKIISEMSQKVMTS